MQLHLYLTMSTLYTSINKIGEVFATIANSIQTARVGAILVILTVPYLQDHRKRFYNCNAFVTFLLVFCLLLYLNKDLLFEKDQ